MGSLAHEAYLDLFQKLILTSSNDSGEGSVDGTEHGLMGMEFSSGNGHGLGGRTMQKDYGSHLRRAKSLCLLSSDLQTSILDRKISTWNCLL